MIKCEMHLHVKGMSGCARVAPEDIAKEYLNAGYGAIAVTNHYMKILSGYCGAADEKDYARIFIDSYKTLKSCCEPYGIKVFLGMELNPDFINTPERCPAAEVLCYGMTEEFILRHPDLYNYSLEELYSLFNKNGIIMFQSHPFREYCLRFDPKFLHGAEIYNGHPTHNSNNDIAEKWAKENRLLGISGSDYHESGNITGGIYIPEEITDGTALVNYIKNNALKFIRKTV